MRFFLSIIILLFTLNTGIAAIIKGHIKDDSGSPIANAIINQKGTSIGTTSNSSGYYEFKLKEGSYTITAQMIGFKAQSITFNILGNETKIIDFELEEQGYELKAVSFSAKNEDPAYPIIRNAIKKRVFHLNQIVNFQSDIYLKGVLRNRLFDQNSFLYKQTKSKNSDSNPFESLGLDSNGKGVVYLCEQQSTLYQTEKLTKQVIHYVKESGDPNGLGIGSTPQRINLYQNSSNIIGNANNEQRYYSPIGSDALNKYKYKLIGEFKDQNQTIYNIQVTPKRKFEKCYSGNIYITDEDYAIHSVKLFASKNEGLNQLDTFQLSQQYFKNNEKIWIVKNQVLDISINILGLNLFGSFINYYDNQLINTPIPDSILNDKYLIKYDDNANSKTNEVWAKDRPITLEDDEIINYKIQDSIYTKKNAPEYIDSVRKLSNKYTLNKLLLTEYNYTSKANKIKFHSSSILKSINFNTVEGFNFSPEFSFETKVNNNNTFKAVNHFRYGFSNKKLNNKLALSWLHSNDIQPSKKWAISATGGRYISQFNSDQPVSELFNTFGALFNESNYFKIYERWLAGIKWEQNLGNGFSYHALALYENRNTLQNTSTFTIFPKNPSSFTSNSPENANNFNLPNQNKSFQLNVGIRYQPRIKYYKTPNKINTTLSNSPIFSINYTKGISGFLNSATNFDKIQGSVSGTINLKKKGTIAFYTGGGLFLNKGNVPFYDYNHLIGNQYIFSSNQNHSFFAAPYYKYSNIDNQFGEVHLEYHLKEFISNKIPIIKQLQWYIVIGVKHYNSSVNNYYTEGYIGLENIGYKLFRMFRVDYVYGQDNYQNKYNAIRIGGALNKVISGCNKKLSAF
jgi:hypothetical protein